VIPYQLIQHHYRINTIHNKAILLGTMLFMSSTAFAEQSLLGGIAEHAAKSTATAVAPEAVKQVDAANQAVKTGKSAVNAVENAPKAIKKQVKKKAVEKTIDLIR